MNKKLIIRVMLVITFFLPTACNSMDKAPEPPGPTVMVIDDETGKPIEGAVAIAIWRGDKKNCNFIQGLHGGCWGFKKAEETVSDKDGKIIIPDFWKTSEGKGGKGNSYDPHLTVYKFGYVCWDQKEIFVSNYKWEKRTDFNKSSRIVRMKKWPEGMSFHEHASFMSDVTSGNIGDAPQQLFNKERRKEGPYISKEIK